MAGKNNTKARKAYMARKTRIAAAKASGKRFEWPQNKDK